MCDEKRHRSFHALDACVKNLGLSLPSLQEAWSKAELAQFISSRSGTKWLHLGFSLLTAQVWSVRLERLRTARACSVPGGALAPRLRALPMLSVSCVLNSGPGEHRTKPGGVWDLDLSGSHLFQGIQCAFTAGSGELKQNQKKLFCFLKPQCSSQSGPGSLRFCILRGCQGELRYTNVSVVDYGRRASAQSRSSKKVLLVFSQEFPISDFTFHVLLIAFRNLRKTQTPNPTKPNPSKALNQEGSCGKNQQADCPPTARSSWPLRTWWRAVVPVHSSGGLCNEEPGESLCLLSSQRRCSRGAAARLVLIQNWLARKLLTTLPVLAWQEDDCP